MTYPARAIANYFIQKSQKDVEALTLMKLSKLIYIAHGWNLAFYNEPLINEIVQAWKFGPVIESVYHEFKHFGMNPIDEPAAHFKVDEKGELIADVYEIDKNDKRTVDLLNNIWKIHKKNTAIQLSNWTHLKGSPWYNAWHQDGGKNHLGQPILNESIKQYFQSL